MSIVRSGRPDGKPAFTESELERHYALPRETTSLEERRRFRHLDLSEMSKDDLDREERLVQFRADREHDPAALAWLNDHLRAIRTVREVQLRLVAREAAKDAATVGIRWGGPPLPLPPAARCPNPATQPRTSRATRPLRVREVRNG